MPHRNLHRRIAFAAALFVGPGLLAHAWAVPKTAPTTGLREHTPAIHALVGARIVVAPGKVIDKGNLIIRDGVITAVGPEASVPSSARIWDSAGKTLYAGFLDAYTELAADAVPTPGADAGARHWNPLVTPETRAELVYRPDRPANEKLRRQGIAVRLVAPAAGIIKGTSALVTTGDDAGARAILKDRVAMHLKLTTAKRQGDETFPNSPMGALTLVRQAFYDARWCGDAWAVFNKGGATPRPERNDALAALGGYLDRKGRVIIDAADNLYLLRADRLGREFDLDVIVRGSGEEYQWLDAVKAAGRPVLVPVSFPKAPNVGTPEMAQAISLEKLMHWDIAPENPGRLEAAGVKIALTTHGLKDPSGFLAGVRQAVQRGLPADAALRALTTTPAALLGVDQRLGSLEVGKAAHVLVTDGDVFDKKSKLLETWIDGQRYEAAPLPIADVRGSWEVQVVKPDGGSESLTIKLAGEPDKPAGTVHRGDKEAKLTQVSLEGAQLMAAFNGKTLGWEGVSQFSATILQDGKSATWLGFVAWPDGRRSALTAKLAKTENKDAPKPGAAEKKPEGETNPESSSKALFAVNYPLGDYGRDAPPAQPDAVVFQHATVWTSGPQGKLDDCDVLVERGQIKAVGKNLEVPKGAVIVDARGKHLSPGIIDCHSHIATDGGVNESSQSITAEVRIGDFIDPKDINIYRQLAGGVTAAQILHGSANTIGGQSQTIKFRWGALPEEMKFAEALPSIKFALGENVKQSNWGDRNRTRYPQTRMGVEEILRDAFRSAVEYRGQWVQWKRNKSGLPPRVDLELEALSEVVFGKRFIHCHSYRQDEILAFLRVCEEFNVRVSTLQHILEGYKVADAIARHGAGGSSFSDWWAYKFEVLDAIPYNGAIMHNAGVVVSFNSDDAELARRLNLEAAKAVKYGGVSETEAFKFVTLNPAQQLGVANHVGSIEPGKDADLVLWSGSPLSSLSRCEQTWIDGRKYFDRAEDLKRRQTVADMRAKLIQRVLASGDPVESADEAKRDLVPRTDIFCGHCCDGCLRGFGQ